MPDQNPPFAPGDHLEDGDLIVRVSDQGGLLNNFPVGRVYVARGVTEATVLVNGLDGNPVKFLRKRFAPVNFVYPADTLRAMPVGRQFVEQNGIIYRVAETDNRNNRFWAVGMGGGRQELRWWNVKITPAMMAPVAWPFDDFGRPIGNEYVAGRFMQRRFQRGVNREVEVLEWVRIRAMANAGLVTVDRPLGLGWTVVHPADFSRPTQLVPDIWQVPAVPEVPAIPPFGMGSKVVVNRGLVDRADFPGYLRDRINRVRIGDPFDVVDRNVVAGAIRVKWGERGDLSPWLSTKWFSPVDGDVAEKVPQGPVPPPVWCPEWEANKRPDSRCAYGYIDNKGKNSGVTHTHCHAQFLDPFVRKNTEYLWTIMTADIPQRWLDYIFGPESPWRKLLPYVGYFQSPDKTSTVFWIHREFIDKKEDISNQLIFTWIKTGRLWTEYPEHGKVCAALMEDDKIHPGIALFLANTCYVERDEILNHRQGWHGSIFDREYTWATLVNFLNAKEVSEELQYLHNGDYRYYGSDRLFAENKRPDDTIKTMLSKDYPHLFKEGTQVGLFGQVVKVSHFNLASLKGVARQMSEKLGYGVDV